MLSLVPLMPLRAISHQAALISSSSAKTDTGLKSRAPVWETPRTQREASITHWIEPFVWLPANPEFLSHALPIYQGIPTPPLPYVANLASAPLYLQGYFNSRHSNILPGMWKWMTSGFSTSPFLTLQPVLHIAAAESIFVSKPSSKEFPRLWGSTRNCL